jgi:hypothetical protein
MTRKISTGEIEFAAKSQPESIEPGALTVDEFCRWARVGRTTAFFEIKAARLCAVKVGARTLIPMENARAWLNSLPKRELMMA